MTQIFFHKTARKQLVDLPRSAQVQIAQKLAFVEIEPFRYLERLKNSELYKIRVGQYRLICELHSQTIVIYVLHVASRDKVYQFLKKKRF